MIPGRLVLSVAAVVMLQDLATTRQLDLTISEGTSMAAAASPDRRSIAIDLLGGIWILPFRGGEAKRITPELLEARQPTWSPDSAPIAFASDRGGHIAYLLDRRTLAAIDLQRDTHRFASTAAAPGELGRPTWSADSHSIAVGSLFAYSTRYREGLNQILVYSSNTSGAASSVLFPDHSAGNRQDTGPVWSPDGFRMAFVSEGALWVVPVDERGGAAGPAQAVAIDQPGSPSWEGDSKRIVDVAHARNRPVTSHELYPAVAYGIDGIEHLSGTSRRGYSPKHSAIGRAYQDVVALIAKSGVTLTPTIGIIGGFRARELGDRTLVFDPRLALLPLSTVAQLTEMAATRPDPTLDARLKPYEATLKAIAGGGGAIVAGTDSPIVPYGLGLHVELESYVHAGLTPFQALQTATVNAARALGIGAEVGTIEPVKLADLTFLGSDPLVDIRHTRDVKRVMRGGRVYSVSDLIASKRR